MRNLNTVLLAAATLAGLSTASPLAKRCKAPAVAPLAWYRPCESCDDDRKNVLPITAQGQVCTTYIPYACNKEYSTSTYNWYSTVGPTYGGYPAPTITQGSQPMTIPQGNPAPYTSCGVYSTVCPTAGTYTIAGGYSTVTVLPEQGPTTCYAPVYTQDAHPVYPTEYAVASTVCPTPGTYNIYGKSYDVAPEECPKTIYYAVPQEENYYTCQAHDYYGWQNAHNSGNQATLPVYVYKCIRGVCQVSQETWYGGNQGYTKVTPNYNGPFSGYCASNGPCTVWAGGYKPGYIGGRPPYSGDDGSDGVPGSPPNGIPAGGISIVINVTNAPTFTTIVSNLPGSTITTTEFATTTTTQAGATVTSVGPLFPAGNGFIISLVDPTVLRKRQNSATGYIGLVGNNFRRVATAAEAAQFGLSNGRLILLNNNNIAAGSLTSDVGAGANGQGGAGLVFAAAVGAADYVQTTFSLPSTGIQWTNALFTRPNNQARFCVANDNNLYGIFRDTATVPEGCESVSLVTQPNSVVTSTATVSSTAVVSTTSVIETTSVVSSVVTSVVTSTSLTTDTTVVTSVSVSTGFSTATTTETVLTTNSIGVSFSTTITGTSTQTILFSSTTSFSTTQTLTSTVLSTSTGTTSVTFTSTQTSTFLTSLTSLTTSTSTSLTTSTSSTTFSTSTTTTSTLTSSTTSSTTFSTTTTTTSTSTVSSTTTTTSSTTTSDNCGPTSEANKLANANFEAVGIDGVQTQEPWKLVNSQYVANNARSQTHAIQFPLSPTITTASVYQDVVLCGGRNYFLTFYFKDDSATFMTSRISTYVYAVGSARGAARQDIPGMNIPQTYTSTNVVFTVPTTGTYRIEVEGATTVTLVSPNVYNIFVDDFQLNDARTLFLSSV